MGVSNDNVEARIQVLNDRKGNCGEVQVSKLCNGDCITNGHLLFVMGALIL